MEYRCIWGFLKARVFLEDLTVYLKIKLFFLDDSSATVGFSDHFNKEFLEHLIQEDISYLIRHRVGFFFLKYFITLLRILRLCK